MTQRPSSLSARIAAFAHAMRFEDIPHDVRELARLHVADAIGVGLGAAGVSAHQTLTHTLLQSLPRQGAATVLGADAAVAGADAALINGTAIHSLEYDDTHMASIVHGSAVILPTALACTETWRPDMDELVRLVVLGWEVLVRIGKASPGSFQQRGFQVTSVGGVVVAALLASVARRFPQEQTVAAMGIAGSQASGIFAFLENGATVKAFHPGWAAHAGLWAAEMAGAGMTGPARVLEGRFGVFDCYAGDGEAGSRLSDMLDTLGQEWHLRDAAFKLYPCCHYIHPFLECAEHLYQAHGERLRGSAVQCRVAQGAATVICLPWDAKQRPASVNDAKYSLPYCLGAALLGKRVDLDFMTAQALDGEALEQARRITWDANPDSRFPDAFDAEIIVTLADGTQHVQRVAQVLGSKERPVTQDRLQGKFFGNVRSRLDEGGAQALWQAFFQDDFRHMQQALRGVYQAAR